MSLILRIVALLLGFLSTWTGLFAWQNFTPPADADPGAINACYLTFAWLIAAGPLFIWSATWRLNK